MGPFRGPICPWESPEINQIPNDLASQRTVVPVATWRTHLKWISKTKVSRKSLHKKQAEGSSHKVSVKIVFLKNILGKT